MVINSFPHREETLRKRRRQRRIKYGIFFLFFVLIVGVVSYLSHLPKVRVTEIELHRALEILKEEKKKRGFIKKKKD